MNQSGSWTTLSRILVVIFGLAACKREPQQRLPERPPEVARIQFTGPTEGWPPHPAGRTDVRAVAWTQLPGDLTDSLAAQLRRIATADQRVREALGDRFAFISISPVEGEAKDTVRAAAARVFQLVFFSHTHNVAVEVRVQEQRVQQVERRPGLDVPEGRAEVEAAIALARRDARLRAAVAGLVGSAILAYPDSGAPGFGHRLLHVTFAREGGDVPLYWAYVDLTDGRVLSAGKEP